MRHRSAKLSEAVRGPARGEADWARRLATAERACCCTARPAVAVVLRPAENRPHPTDLLLCGHHYRASADALAAAGAIVYDENGAPTATSDSLTLTLCEAAVWWS